MYKALRAKGFWKFKTLNFLVIVDFNDGLWRTVIYRGNDELTRGYSGYFGAPRWSVIQAIRHARIKMGKQ